MSDNGQYKKRTYLRKTEVLAQKRRLFDFHSGINLNKTDIIPIVNYAFSKSFGVTSSNITAIATCGWNLLNYNLLSHIELQSDQTITLSTGTPLVTPLNNNQNLQITATSHLQITATHPIPTQRQITADPLPDSRNDLKQLDLSLRSRYADRCILELL